MGLKSADDVAVDDDGGGKSVSCSICLEVVVDNGGRSWAKLQCGHEFHLDCIGSAFNVKGAMQCPNCRKIEKGQWLYANRCRSIPEFSMDDWTHDEDLYDLGYSELSFGGLHWCPFGQLARVPSSFEEGDFPTAAYHDVVGQHAIFAEHGEAIPSATHPCPYIAYLGPPPMHPSASSSSSSVTDVTNFGSHWNGASRPSEVPASFSFPAADHHFHSWDPHSPPFSTSSGRIGGADQPSVPPVIQRSSRSGADVQRPGSFMHPFLVSHPSLGSRSGSSVATSMIPPYPGSNARSRDRVQALQAYYQQQPSNPATMHAPLVSGTRRSSNHRGSVASSSEQSGGGFYFIPTSSSGLNFQDPENPVSARFRTWEREPLPPSFTLGQVDSRDSSWAVLHPAPGGSDPAGHRSFRQRHGSERAPSHNR